MNQKEDGGGPGPSSGTPRQCHGPVHGGHVLPSQGNGTPSSGRQTTVRCALDKKRRAAAQLPRLGKPSSRPSGVSPGAVGTSSDMTASEYNRAYWNSIWSSQDSTSDTDTTDGEEECSTHSSVQKKAASASTKSYPSGAVGGVAVGYAASDKVVDDLIELTTTGSEGASVSYVDMAALLDPNQPPSVVLKMFAGCDDEVDLMPSIEEYLRVDPTIRPVGESSDDEHSTSSP